MNMIMNPSVTAFAQSNRSASGNTSESLANFKLSLRASVAGVQVTVIANGPGADLTRDRARDSGSAESIIGPGLRAWAAGPGPLAPRTGSGLDPERQKAFNPEVHYGSRCQLDMERAVFAHWNPKLNAGLRVRHSFN